MVTCRPDGAGFIDPRSIATPLLRALDAIPEQVEVEFLRPPTLNALDDRLRDETKPRVHIVHFDGHGVYDKGVGLGFLLFEDENHQKHQVDAEQLGTLLNESGIPLMVLNACQSAQPDDRNPFASVASRLIESGVGGVVAMNYSVLVETAKRFTAEFYGALARGLSASAAMDIRPAQPVRRHQTLHLHPSARGGGEILHLQDWFLPALVSAGGRIHSVCAFQIHRKDRQSALKAVQSPQRKKKNGDLSGFTSRPSSTAFTDAPANCSTSNAPSPHATLLFCTVLADRARPRWLPKPRSGSRGLISSSARRSSPSKRSQPRVRAERVG